MKETNVKLFLGITCAVIYGVLRIGDLVALSIRMDGDLIRYVLVGISSIIVTFILVLVSTRKNSNMDMNDITKKFVVAPLIVSAIILVYGIYSVYSNLDKIKKSSIYSVYSSMFKDEASEIENSAMTGTILNWGITALVYLITSEGVLFFMKKRVNVSLDDHSANLADTISMQNDVINSVGQGYANQNGIGQGYANQNGIGQGYVNQNGVSQRPANQNGIGQGYANQNGVGQGYANQNGIG